MTKINFDKFLYLKDIDPDGALLLLMEWVKDHPFDLDTLFRLAIYIQTFPFLDYKSSLEFLSSVLKNDSLNVKAIILMAFIEDLHMAQIRDNTLSAVKKAIFSINKKNIYYNQLFLLQAKYHREKSDTEYIEYLILSIQMDPEASLNHWLLSKRLKRLEKVEESINQMKIAIKNVQLIYSFPGYEINYSIVGNTKVLSFEESNIIDSTDYDEFISENIRGIHVTDVNYSGMQEDLMKLIHETR